MNKQLQEKIKYSEQLIDKYLNELNITAQGVNAASYAASAAAGVSAELRRGFDWAKEKIEQRKRQKELIKKQKEQERQKMMLAKKQQQQKKQRMA